MAPVYLRDPAVRPAKLVNNVFLPDLMEKAAPVTMHHSLEKERASRAQRVKFHQPIQTDSCGGAFSETRMSGPSCFLSGVRTCSS